MAFLYHPPRHIDGNYCVTPSDMRLWESTDIDDNPSRSHELMELAGRSVADHVLSHYDNMQEALILCGTGNNGGDGFVAAYYLNRCGFAVHLVVFDDEVTKSQVARSMFLRIRNLPRIVLHHPSDAVKILDWKSHRNLVVIDAIFGIGYRPAHSMLMTRVYQCVEELGCPVVSVDIPSGINAVTGYRGDILDEMPPRAMKATHTVTFGAPKSGHLNGEGPSYTGELYCHDIGLIPWHAEWQRSLILSDDYCDKNYSPGMVRGMDVHKGRCGHVLVIGGDPGMPGAACLCARAALRAGCGLVSIGAKKAMRAADEIMVTQILNDDRTLNEDVLKMLMTRSDCIVFGPGLGRDDTTLKILDVCQSYSGRIVFDADGIWALTQGSFHFDAPECFVTPHPLEAGMLTGMTSKEVLFNPIHAATQILDKYHMTVILKSHTSLVASRIGKSLKMSVSPYPNPGIVSAGIGDVFAGILAACIVQARGGAWNRWFDAFDVSSLAVNMHSRAGRTATSRHGNSACASDLIESLHV